MKKTLLVPYRLPNNSTKIKLPATTPLGEVTTHEGVVLNLASPIWKFPRTGLTIDWNKAPMTDSGLVNATKRYFAWMVECRAESTIRVAWGALQSLRQCPSFLAADKLTNGSNGTITHEVFHELAREFVGKVCPNKIFQARGWYKWCMVRGYQGFSASEWPAIQAINVEQPEPYRALLGPAPDETPLTPTQKRELYEALRSARQRKTLLIEHLAVIWLVFYRGIRPEEATSMIEADLKRAGNHWMVSVPYAKKGTDRRKGGCRDLRITPYLGRMIEEMIRKHQKARKTAGLPDPTSARWPLFPRETPYNSTFRDPMGCWFQQKGMLGIWIIHGGEKLGLSFRLGAHRLRNTFALDLVQSGACPEELRIELTHASSHWIHHYFHPGDSQVDMLDAVETERLGAVFQSLTTNMTDVHYPRRPDESSRTRIRYGDPTKGIYVGVGECGCKGSKCAVGLANTLNCYTCIYFFPFKQGKHELVLRQVNDTIDEMRLRGAEESDLSVWRQYRKGLAHVIGQCQAVQAFELGSTGVKPRQTRRKEKKHVS